ncbi:MAG: thioredoxin [Bacteroidales bacterium]|nr:thioredoxin [Bacteroidales bacterium]
MKRKAFILTAILSLFLAIGNVAYSGNDGKVKEVSEKNFENSISKGVVIVDFWATWCRPCLMQAPIFEEAAKEMKGKVTFLKIDVDKAKNVATKYRISSIPTLIVFKDGKEVTRTMGTQQKENIIAVLNKVLESK